MSTDAILNYLRVRTFGEFIEDEKVPREDKDFVIAILTLFDRETKGV